MNYESLEKIKSLKEGIEVTTGETYNDLTEAVQGLKDGYGKGEGIPEADESIVFPEDTTGLPNVSVRMGDVTATYYRVTDFVPLEKMQEAKIIYNFGGDLVGSSFEIGASLPSGSYLDSGFRVASIVADNETLPSEMLGIEFTFPKAGTYFAYSDDMGGALILEVAFPDEISALLEGTIKEITIPNDVTDLASGAFGGCKHLEEINADKSHKFYTSIDGILYTKNGKKLVSYPAARKETEYIMPDSVEEVESMAFNNSTSIEKVALSENIKALPENLGIENKETDVALVLNPDTLAQGDVYPVGSPLITTVTIPEGSTYLSVTAFDNMPNVKNLYYNAECELEKVGIADGKSTVYRNAISMLQNLKKVEIGEAVKNIPNDFLNNSVSKNIIEHLTLGENVETIGNNAFAYLTGIKELKIGNKVKSIGFKAFNGLQNVEGTLVIPDSVTELVVDTDEWGMEAGHTFNDMPKITNVVIGKGLTKIVLYMFAYCQSLTDVVIPSNIKTVGNYSFQTCSNLTTVRMEEGVEEIGDKVFSYCISLSDIYIPRSVVSIGFDPFDMAGTNVEGGLTIHGYAGSYAETFATENGYNFEVIEE